MSSRGCGEEQGEEKEGKVVSSRRGCLKGEEPVEGVSRSEGSGQAGMKGEEPVEGGGARVVGSRGLVFPYHGEQAGLFKKGEEMHAG